MTGFQQRAVTAIIFAAVMLSGLFCNELTFKLLFAIITGGCLWELTGMLMSKDGLFYALRRVLAVMIGTIPYLISALYASGELKPFLILFFLIFIGIVLELAAQSTQPFQNIGALTTGVLYIGVPFALLLSIYYQYNERFIFGILLLTWSNDTWAYLIGSKIGKTPLLPRISPKKTWEGTIAGFIGCVLTGVLIHYTFHIDKLSLPNWLMLGGIVGIFGTIGDLVESMLKRSVGVKDSGSFMPGHGGFLDRFDAFLFIIPFVMLYLFF
jgi:phosphatidate cytidylyltransferase